MVRPQFLLVKNSIDTVMWECLQKKLSSTGKVLDGEAGSFNVSSPSRTVPQSRNPHPWRALQPTPPHRPHPILPQHDHHCAVLRAAGASHPGGAGAAQGPGGHCHLHAARDRPCARPLAAAAERAGTHAALVTWAQDFDRLLVAFAAEALA